MSFGDFVVMRTSTDTNLDSIAYRTPNLYGIAYCYKPAQHVTVLNTVGHINKVVSITILYYNIIILWDNRRVCGPSLTETSLCGAYLYILAGAAFEGDKWGPRASGL